MLIKVRSIIVPLLRVNNTKLSCNAFSSSSTFKEEKIKVKNWNINYLKVGNGPHNILCMPGALGSIWTDFKPQVEGINRDKFTLVAWDPPGYGKSRPPERDFPDDFYERDADFAIEFMKKVIKTANVVPNGSIDGVDVIGASDLADNKIALKIPKYSVLGWSDGGTTSLILAAKYPEVLNKLVVWGTNAFILPHELEMYKKTKDINSWSKRMRQPMIDVYGEELFRKYWVEWLEGMEGVFKANNGDICAAVLKDIKCPTLILYGQKDPLVDSVHASHLHTHIVGSRIHLYPDGKHNVHLAYAEDFNKRVEEFLLL